MRVRGFAFPALLLVATSSAAGEPPAAERLAGDWVVELRTKDLGVLAAEVRLAADGPSTFRGSSRTDAVEALLGARAPLARAFLGVPAGTGLLTVASGATKEGGVLEADVTLAAFGAFRLTGRAADDGWTGTLHGKGGEWGTVLAARPAPDRTQPALGPVGEAVASVLEERLYDPRLLRSAVGKGFLATMRSEAKNARDDVELAFCFYAGTTLLRVSHLALLRPDPKEARGTPTPTARTLSLERFEDGSALLRPGHFAGSVAEVDEAFVRIAAKPPAGLIVDLRGNPGGNLSAMGVAAHLLSEERPAGLFVGGSWWKRHDAPPTSESPGVVRFQSYEVEPFRRALADAGAVSGWVLPRAPRYDGPVAVLVDGRTASACEPLVHFLKASRRATVVGSRTAGAMLSSEEFPLPLGWVLRVPTADYLTAEGTRLEGKGVTPDVEAKGEEALERAKAALRAK